MSSNNHTSNPRKRTATSTTNATMNGTTTMAATDHTQSSDTKGTTTKRNKFENTPVITSLIQQTEYTLLDVQRLLHVMETTTPPMIGGSNNDVDTATTTTTTSTSTTIDTSSTHTWKDYEIRATLLQDMYTNVYHQHHETARKKKNKAQQQQLLEELQPRIQTILQITKDYIVRLKEDESMNPKNTDMNGVDPYKTLFSTAMPLTTSSAPIVAAASTKTQLPIHDTVSLPPPQSSTTTQASTPKNPPTTKSSSTSMVEIQQQQREQMEMAVAQMAGQLKEQTRHMNEQIQQQNHSLVDELHTTIEHNVQDVTNVTKMTQQQLSNSTRRNYSTWTMIILMAMAFVVTFLLILTIPKPTIRTVYTKYIKSPSSSSAASTNETHICRLLPSGIEECYYIPDTSTQKNNPDEPPVEEIQVVTELPPPSQQQQEEEEVNDHITSTDDMGSVVETHDYDRLYTELRQAAVTEMNIPRVHQLLQTHPSLLYYTDPNGWSLLHELARSRSSSTNVQDRMELIQYMVQQNSTLIQLTTNFGLTPYDLAKTNIISENIHINDQEYYQTILSLLQPPTIGESLETPKPLDENVATTTTAAATTTSTIENIVTDTELDHSTTTITESVDIPPPKVEEEVVLSIETPESDSEPHEAIVDPVLHSETDDEDVLPEEEEETEMYNDDADADDDGLSIFALAQHAIAFRDVDLLRSYVEDYPTLLHDVDEEDNGMSLLHYAVQYPHAYDIIQYLLDMSLAEQEQVSDNDDDNEAQVPIWAITTFGMVNDETGEVEVPPQTPYDLALEQSYSSTMMMNDGDNPHPIIQLLQDYMGALEEGVSSDDYDEDDDGDENDIPLLFEDTVDTATAEECDVDVTTGLCRPHDMGDDATLDAFFQLDLPNDSDDILANALRDFDEMKQG